MDDRPPFGTVLDTLDGLNLPHGTQPSALPHKEWQHFSLVDKSNGLHAIVNLNLASPGGAGSSAGAARVLTAIWEQDHGWHGDIDTIPQPELGLVRHRIDMRMGSTALSFDGKAYYLRVANRRGTIEGELTFHPLVAPLMMRNNTPVGHGHINWLVVPRLAVDGRLRIEDRIYHVDGSPGYHDHNWGSWNWGDDFAWEWGFAVAETTGSESPRAVVFDRTTDRSRLAVKELTMAVWEGDALSRVFTRREIAVRAEGFLRCGRLLKLPRIMALVEPQQTHDIPARFTMSARENSDYLEAEFRPEQGMQVIVPNDVDLQNTIINEVLGRFSARGMIKGQPVTFSGHSFFEFLT